MPTPTLIQHTSGSNTKDFQKPVTGAANPVYNLWLPNPAQAGNCIVVGLQYDNGLSGVPSVTDDVGNTYTEAHRTNDTTNVQQAAIFIALNVTAGARKIMVQITAAANSHLAVSVAASEFSNVATSSALEGHNGNFGTSATITAGSLGVLATSGDLLYQYVVQTTGGRTYTAGSQANITWRLLSADNIDGQGVQYGVYNATSALNPTFTQSSSGHFLSIAIALKSATAGGSPAAGMRITNVQHISLFSSGTGGPGYSTPTTIQFPCSGDLLVIMISAGGSGGGVVTGITDNKSNTWQQATGFSPTGHKMRCFYVNNPVTGGDLTLTVTSSTSTNSDQTLMMYDVVGSDLVSPLDVVATASGNLGTYTSPLSTFVLTPSTVNGIVFGEIQQQFQTVVSITAPSGALSDMATYSDEPIDGPENVDQNGGFGHLYNSDTAAETWTWGFIDGSNPQGNWAAYGVSFKAASSPADTIVESLVYKYAG